VRPGPAGPTLEGYVYNKTDMMAERMQVSIEQLDAAGNVVGQTTSWCSALYRPATAPTFRPACRPRRATV
jgi:hypothetical protein